VQFAVFISGFAAVIGQTLLIREGLAFFSGNELISGIVLFLWLFWTGLGSLLYSNLKIKINPLTAYSLLIFLQGIFLILSLLVFRIAPKIFSLPFGEVVDIGKMSIITLIALGPTCLITGALFPVASNILSPQRVYLIEGLGFFVGGLFCSFLFISILPPLGILLLVFVLLLFAEFILLKKMGIIILLPIFIFLLIKTQNLEVSLRKIQMPGVNLIGLYESKYGTIAITRTESQLNFYTNGFFDFACPDLYSAEEAVHYPLLIHPQPISVLLVGGGLGGAIEQVLKHSPIEKLVYLELDPKLIEVANRYLDLAVQKERVKIFTGDARFFIKNTKDNFDCIIINLPDPINGQLNRYYTEEFFREVKRCLKPDGLISIKITAPPDIVSPLYSQYLGTVYKTLKTSFKNLYIIPSARIIYIATDTTYSEKIIERLKKSIKSRNLNLTYVNDYFFEYNLTEEKIEYLSLNILNAKSYKNTDLKPVCYYFNSILWGGMVLEDLKKVFIRLFNINPVCFFGLLLLTFLFWRRKAIIYASVFSIGASEISAEIILIILFQVFYGYIYSWIGIIVGLFMLGLAIGTYIFIKSNFLKNRLTSKLMIIQIFVSIYFAFILFLTLIRIPHTNYIIAIMVFLGGFLGGLHFPLSIRILGDQKAGLIYGVDLFGSSLGAFVTTIIFIPIIGIPTTILIFILLNLFTSIGLNYSYH